MNTDAIAPMAVSDLTFDCKNPRLPEFGLTKNSTEAEVIKVLWTAMDVRELVMSIAASGFLRHEPLIVAVEDGKNVVIEGNRRLAAVKFLIDPAVSEPLNADVPIVAAEAKEALMELPVIFGTRGETWRHLGFKHVNGPAKWSSYAKARYIAEVHRNLGVSLDDIARQIGDTHKTVPRLFLGLIVMEQAERMKVFSRDDRWRSHFSFSHLYTGLSYPGISEFIGLHSEPGEGRDPVPPEKKEELGELFLWMYGSKRQKRPPVIETQNPHLGQLDSVVSDREALAAIRDSNSLQVAFELSRPSSTVFEESLLASKRHLQKSRAMLSTGYDASDDLLRTAGAVANLAEDLYDEMGRKGDRRRHRRIAEAG